jgi:hypothetical protein
MAETPNGGDHPQTINLEPDARGGPAAPDESRRQAEASADEEDRRERASPLGDAQSALGQDAEAIRRHAHGGRSIGDSIGGSAGLDVGSGTAGHKGDLGGGDPQKTGA